MSNSSRASRTSRGSSQTTAVADRDAAKLFRAVVADINFRPSQNGSPVTVKDGNSVRDLLERGPNAIMGNERPQARWIHLPANNMVWVEELMSSLHQEQIDHNVDFGQDVQEVTRFDGVLRQDLWRKAFHGRHSDGIHSRFMTPFATRYSSSDPDGVESDESESSWQKANVIMLYMPYLHWETYNSWKDRQTHIADMKKLHFKGKTCDCLDKPDDPSCAESKRQKVLLHEYLLADAPLHDRRTLDQSYFYNLRNVAHHDQDQVIGLHTWNRAEQKDSGRKMMMTDQLWMWVVDETTVITAFPETGTGHGDEADVLHRLLENLPRSIREGKTKSMHGIIAFIIEHCTGVFHRSDINPDIAFFEFFADEIGVARTETERMFREFRHTSQEIEKLWKDPTVSATHMSKELDSLFSIRYEIQQLEEVEKIISDLEKIDFLCGQQEEVARVLFKCCRSSSGRHPSRSMTDLCDLLKSRREAWAGMALTARSAHDSLHGLLDLKQRQATVSEARSVRYQVELSARQGHSIMLLTGFTIFFLPISVIATIFGMNAKELVGQEGGKLSFSTISAVMFPTSITLVILVLISAFNERFRDMIFHFANAVHEAWINLVGRQQPRRFEARV